MRLVIGGGPRTGKTTRGRLVASASGVRLRSTDDLITLGWSEASDAACAWFDEPGDWVVEGVAVFRALRKWLASHPDGKPCDRVVYLSAPYVALSGGQAAMSKGCHTVWLGIVDDLVGRGVEIETERADDR